MMIKTNANSHAWTRDYVEFQTNEQKLQKVTAILFSITVKKNRVELAMSCCHNKKCPTMLKRAAI